MTNLHNLPPEVKIFIVNELARQKTLLPGDDPIGYEYADAQLAALAALARTNKFFNVVATPLLYENGVRRHPYLLCWATDISRVGIMRKVLRTTLADPNIAMIRFQAEYSPWDPKAESSKELFWRFYRRDGHRFQDQAMYQGRPSRRHTTMDATWVPNDLEDETDELADLQGFLWGGIESDNDWSSSSDDDSASDDDSTSDDNSSFDEDSVPDGVESGNEEEIEGEEDARIVADDGLASEASSIDNFADDNSPEDGSSEDASVADDFSDGEDVGSEDGPDLAAAPEPVASFPLFPLPDVVAEYDDDSDSNESGRREIDVSHVMHEGYLRCPEYDDEDMDNIDILGMYWMPVHMAARMGNMEALELLLEHGALVNVSSQGFCRSECHQVPGPALYWDHYTVGYPAWTPLHIALCHGQIDVAKRLMEHCEHLQERLLNNSETTEPWQVLPRFISAIRHGHMDLAEWCLQQGSERDAVNAKQPGLKGATLLWRAFWEATDAKNFEAALKVLLRNGADINHDLGKGHTMLMEACLYGLFDEAITLIKAGAKVDITFDEFNRRSLVGLSYHERSIRIPFGVKKCGLLEVCCGPTPVIRRPDGFARPTMDSRLPYPRRRGPDWKTDTSAQREVIRLLLDSPARAIGKRDPLQIACFSHNATTLSTLLELGVDASSASTDNLTPLECATLSSRWFKSREWFDSYSECIDLLRQHLNKRPKGKDRPRCNQALQNVMNSGILDLDTDYSRRIWAALVELVTHGLADGNSPNDQRFKLMTRLFSHGFGMYQLALRLLKHGFKTPTRIEWDAIWANMNIRVQAARIDPRDSFGSSKEAYRFCKAMDPKERFLKDPFFLAVAMAAKEQSLVDALVKYGRYKSVWISYPSCIGSPEIPYVPVAELRFLRQFEDFEPPKSVEAIDDGSDIECEPDTESCLCTGTHIPDCYFSPNPKTRNCLMFLSLRHAGWSLFHLAIRFRQYGVIKVLVKQAANIVHETTNNGWNAGYIMCVKEWFDEKIVKFLLAHGVDPHVGKSGRWTSPLDYAREEGSDPRAVGLMLEAYPIAQN
ncbi:uncharacterized protein N0V96_007518 [Colletotrichum fioriniae]|uniref:uncharacterized protein n=1 Tax=Colletotrichum fioriniae TaxID=710243 RepID=UPI0023018668|nr:uncharacterized protein COL516b_005906 [Colletotrichum fioriniae]KAJ0304548.1 hypothetical protein COL516b_005906 [Colletotrichum fioriniae]KAJ3942030.1 hypothetical protein N0V96_007518 [Colletotrichum fioriniae]